MKTLKIIAVLLLSCWSTTITIAQFNTFGGNGGYTLSAIQTTGIGTFPLISDVQAKLHVNAFYCYPSGYSVDNGMLFRTDGDNSYDCMWQMYTGTSGALVDQDEMGRLWVNSNYPNDFILDATNPHGGLQFWVEGKSDQTSNLSMIILGGSGTNKGYVGIGALGSAFNNPLHLLDVHGGDINVGPDATYGYMLGGFSELYDYGEPDNIFVGYLAGASDLSTLSYPGLYNTACGNSAGTNLTYGLANTLIGAKAGYNLTGDPTPPPNKRSYAYWNTFTGIEAGYYADIAFGDCYYGKCAGFHCNGNRNAMFGNHAGDGSGGVTWDGTYAADSNDFLGFY